MEEEIFNKALLLFHNSGECMTAVELTESIYASYPEEALDANIVAAVVEDVLHGD